MGLAVNTNTQSLFAQRALSKNTYYMQRSLEQLSTGFKINKAADDAAGLSISEKMTSEIKGLKKAKQNAMDGISMIQTAEGALSIVQDNIQRIRELTVQSLNETNDIEELNAIQREINERLKTIDAISKATKFNGISIIYDNSAAGDNQDIVLQTGANFGQITTINFGSQTASAETGIDIDISATEGGGDDSGHLIEGTFTGFGFSLDSLKVTKSNPNAVASISGAAADDSTEIAIRAASGGSTGVLDLLDKVITNVSRMRSYLGAMQNSLESKIEYLDVAHENISSARSRIKDVDIASASSILVKNQILQQSAAAMLGQANAAPQIALDLLP